MKILSYDIDNTTYRLMPGCAVPKDQTDEQPADLKGVL
jgi:hypothetical protein